MSTALKMAASAAVAAALTAALFLTLWERPAPSVTPVEGPPSENAPREDASPLTAEDPGAPDRPQDLPRIEGNGIVRGRVATKDGDGVEGVEVVATPQMPLNYSPSGERPPDLDLEEEVRQAVAAAHLRVTGTRRATTDSDGNYEIRGLSDRKHRVQPYAEGYDIRPAAGQRPWGVEPGGTVDFVASVVIGVHVRIEGIDETISRGPGVLRASSEESLKNAGASWWDPERPVMRLPPGTWWLQAVQGRERERLSEPRTVTLEVGAPPPSVVLTLRERPGLRGSVKFEDDLAPTRVDVYAMRFEGDEPPAAQSLRRTRDTLRARYDRNTRRYSFRDIEPGRYVVWVTLGRARVMGSAVVEIVDHLVEQDLVVRIDDPDRYVTVRVIGPDGKPLPARGTQFATSYFGHGTSISGGGVSIAKGDGSWLVSAYGRGDIPEADAGGTYVLKVTHERLGAREVTYDPKVRKDIEVRFGAASSLAVTVSGLEQTGFARSAGLYLKNYMAERGISLSSRPARRAGDVFTFEPMQPGNWFIVLVMGGGNGAIMADRLQVTASEGENRIAWALPAFHTVRLEPADESRRLSFSLVHLDPAGNWTHQYVSSSESGGAVFLHVPPGRYELVGTCGGEKRRIPLNVPAQTHVRVE